MRASLLSELGSVRRIAEIELVIARLLFGLAGIVSLAIWIFWSRFLHSRLVGRLTAHQPEKLYRGRLFNAAFFLVGGGALVAVAWIWASGVYPFFMPRIFTKEDGLIEYTTAFLFLITSGWAAYLAFRMPETKRRLIFFFLAVGFFFCFGEELSWGQRIFNFATPDIFQKVNVQDEFNLHNSLGYAADHVFIIGVIFFGSIIPVLVYRYRALHHFIDLTGLPVASLGLAFGFAIVSALHGWTIYILFPKTPLRVAELRELLSALGFLILMVEVNRSLSRNQALSD